MASILSSQDEHLLKIWEKHGVPKDTPTRDYLATDLLPRLWNEYKLLNEIIDELKTKGA